MLLILYIALIPVVILILKVPKIGLLLTIFLSLTSFSSAYIGGLYRIVILLTIVSFVIHLLMRKPIFVSSVQNWLVLAFLGFCLSSIIFASNLDHGITALMAAVKSVVLYFIIINIIKEKSSLNQALWMIIFSGVFLSLIGISNYILPGFFGALLRIASTKGDANLLALVLVFIIPLTVVLLKSSKKLIPSIILIICLITLLASVMLTFSRGGIIASGVVYAMLLFKKEKDKKTTLVLVLILFIFFIVLFPQVWGRLRTLSFGGAYDRSIFIRLKLLTGGIKMFWDYPVFGVGLGNFLDLSTRYTSLVSARVAHNMYLQVAAETGIFGIIAFVSLIISAFVSLKYTKRRARVAKEPFLLDVANGVEVSLIGVLIASAFLSTQFNSSFWIAIALSVVLQNLSDIG